MNEQLDDEYDDELGESLRSGLRDATSGVGRTSVADLASSLRQRRAAGERHSRQFRFTAIAAAAALIAVIVGAGVWLTNGDGDRDGIDVVADQPTTTQEPGPFVGYEPGWHEIDPGPVEAMNSASLAWTGSEIIVAGGMAWTDGPQSGAFAYDPASREWRQLPDPPMADPTVVATDHGLVAIGISEESASGFSADRVWATLAMSSSGSDEDTSDDTGGDGTDPGSGGWELMGALETAPELAAAGGQAPDEPSGRPTVLWTGERVIDVTHGTVLDPESGETTSLAMPSDVIEYTHLSTTNAVWTGEEVVLVAWNEADGLAWDAAGESFRTVPGLPSAQGSNPNIALESTAVGTDGEVALMEWTSGSTGGGRTAVFDVAEEQWITPPARPTSPDRFYCPLSAAFVDSDLVVASCTGTDTDPGAPVRLEGDRWVEIGTPRWSASCCFGTWLSAADALVVWATDTDTTNNPEAPYVRGAIWIPGGEGQALDEPGPTTTATREPSDFGTDPGRPTQDPQCRLQVLADLTEFLPAGFDPTPQRGIGGMPNSSDLCARFWGTPASPGIHVTQRPGKSLYGIGNVSATGRYRWGSIEDGYGIEFTGEPMWSVQAYGISEDDFTELVDGLVSSEDRTLPIEIDGMSPNASNGSTVTSVETSAEPAGRAVIRVGFSEQVANSVSVFQGDQPAGGECSQPEGPAGQWFLNASVRAPLSVSMGVEPGTAQRIQLDVSGDSGLLSGAVTCDFEGLVQMAFGLPGPQPMTVSVGQSSNQIRVTVG